MFPLIGCLNANVQGCSNFFVTMNEILNPLILYTDSEYGYNYLNNCSYAVYVEKRVKTGALEAPFTLNPFKCVSFLTTFGNCDTPDGLSDDLYGEWVCSCDDCQDACPYNIKHNWSEGEVLTALEDITSDILPENFDELSDEFIIKKVIPKTAEHLQEKDVQALKKNAARSAVNSKNV